MAPMRMKLRVRRRGNAVAGAAAGVDQPEEEEEEEGGRSRGSGRRKKTANTTTATTTAAANVASWSPPPSSSASARAAMAAAEEASPDSKCPICLDRFNNLAYLDRCLHRFCFPCIQEWSHNKAECPLCKQPFASILHSVRAEDDFKEYTLRPPPANSSVAATVAMVAAMASAARSDHQMRLMLRRHRGADGEEVPTRRRRRERGGRGGGGGGRRSGVWEWYLDSPPLTLPPLPRHPAVSPVVAEDSEEGEDPGERRTRAGADLTERGVIFEGLTGLGGAVVPAAPNDRASRRLMTRLAARQRLQREGGTVRRLRERETVAFRRALYRNAIRVRGAAGVGGNHGQQRDITAESFRRNPTHLNRLRPWLRRELTVLYGAHGSLVDIVQRIIMARVARHGLEDTPTIEEELRQFLLARTDHFLHELVSFARSPLSLESYDLQAAYEPPDTAMELGGTSSSSDSSSVIAISEGEEEEGPAGGRSTERSLAMTCGAQDDGVQAGSCLSLATWDDETPGPSYSTTEPSRSLASPPFGHAPREAGNEEEEGGDKEEGECLIVGYKKPIAERTPELVQLSSDSEEEAKKKTEDLPPLPPATPPLSYLPTIPPSTSGAFSGERDDEQKEKDGSWSGSSGGSGNSVCALSPAPPGESERRRAGDGKSGGGETEREKKKRKRRRGRERSGTLYNPNRSIYPAMMRHRSHSSSPFHSSVGSPDSTWEFHCSQVSPLTSSVSSPSRCSSSSFSSSSFPPPAPMPSLSPNSHHREKPGGKRKYKSRHLDSDDRDPTWRPSSREKEARRRRESRSRRADRSPSVEIIYEGVVSPNAAQTSACKRRRKRQRRTRHSSSPVIITLDSDSSLGAASSSSPISSQQTVDFSDLPPLPSVHSDGVGGALGAEIGELPVDILDRGSEGSEVEPAGRSEAVGPVAIEDSEGSDLDVENVEDSGLLLDDDDDEDTGPMEATAANPRRFRPIGEKDAASTDPIEASSSDSRLLTAILNDLKGMAPKRKQPPVNFDPGWSPDPAPRRPGDRCDGGEAPSDQKRGFHLPACRPAVWPPALERLKEVKDVPPLLKQASPVRSYNRNTPPPLKHKDAGSPHLSPVDPHSPRAAGSVSSPVGLESNPGDSRPEDTPPSSVLKRHPSRGEPASVGSTSSGRSAPVEVHGINSTSHKPPAATCWSYGLENRSTSASHLELNFSELHSSRGGAKEMPPPSPVDLHPGNSLSADDFHSAKTGRSKEKPALRGETGRTCLVAPADPRSSSCGGASSGVDRYDSPPPSSVEFRTQNPSSPVDPHSSSSSGSSVPTAAPSGRSAPSDAQPSPKPPASSAAAEPLDPAASPLLGLAAGSPPARLPAAGVRSSSSTTGNHLNHAALSSASFDSHSKLLPLCNHFDPTADSQFPVDSRPKNSHGDFQPHDHVTSSPESGEKQWTSNASIDGRSDPQSPIDERWNTHTHSAT